MRDFRYMSVSVGDPYDPTGEIDFGQIIHFLYRPKSPKNVISTVNPRGVGMLEIFIVRAPRLVFAAQLVRIPGGSAQENFERLSQSSVPRMGQFLERMQNEGSRSTR
jgi:hypothetical protein